MSDNAWLGDIRDRLDRTSPEGVDFYFTTRKKSKDRIQYEVVKTLASVSLARKFIETAKATLPNGFALAPAPTKPSGGYRPTLTEYDPAVPLNPGPGEHVEFIEAREVEYLGKILEDMTRSDLPVFDIEAHKNLWAYAVKMNNGLTLFRKYTQGRILEKRGWIPLLMQDGVLSEIRGSVLTIDEGIDCIYNADDERLYILNRTQFEGIFSFMDYFSATIKENLHKLEEKRLVDSTEHLWNLCRTDPRKVRKLYTILRGRVLDKLSTSDVNKVNHQYKLGLNFTADDEIMVNRENIWTVLRVLDDDYLVSPVTDNTYEVYAKSKVRHRTTRMTTEKAK